MEIVKYPNPILMRKCAPVPHQLLYGEVEKVALEMRRVMRAHGGIGLSAPQVGIDARLFVLNIDLLRRRQILPPGCPWLFINPSCYYVEDIACERGKEGCLSLPNQTVMLWRASAIGVKFETQEGAITNSIVLRGLAARCVQHECDHLDGISILDREQQQEAAARAAEQRQREDSAGMVFHRTYQLNPPPGGLRFNVVGPPPKGWDYAM